MSVSVKVHNVPVFFSSQTVVQVCLVPKVMTILDINNSLVVMWGKNYLICFFFRTFVLNVASLWHETVKLSIIDTREKYGIWNIISMLFIFFFLLSVHQSVIQTTNLFVRVMPACEFRNIDDWLTVENFTSSCLP